MLLMRMTILIAVACLVNSFWDSGGSHLFASFVAHGLLTNSFCCFKCLFFLHGSQLHKPSCRGAKAEIFGGLSVSMFICKLCLISVLTSAVALASGYFTEKYLHTGTLLLEEIISSCGIEGVDAVVDAIKRRISESQHQKDNSIPGWWRVS